jgi:LuxR family maltose regulon positive regulatory protein
VRRPQRSNAGSGWRTGPPSPPTSPTRTSLAAKTHVPAVRPGWLARPELLTSLNDAAEARLVTIVAPAGYGKSTLLALWHADPARSKELVVFTADSRDSDPVLLWSGIIGALAAALPAGTWSVPARLLRRSGDGIDTVMLPALQAILAEAAVPRGLTLALDDWHLVTEPMCHHQLAALAGMLPPGCQLLISSRHPPSMPVARLRANGRLLEIGQADLRLSEPQAAALTRTVSGLTLPADSQRALTAVTEGWPAAVYLIARALRGHPGPHTVPSVSAVAHLCVDDYIAEELLGDLDPGQAAALARTAVLSRFTMPLCAHVAGDDLPVIDAHRPSGLPVIAVDDTRGWLRHHHLVRQALLRRLRRDEPHLVEVLHHRAAAWHAEHGLVEDAIDHTLAAGDTDAAVDLIAAAHTTFVGNGRHATVGGWLNRLGDRALAGSAPAVIVAAWIAALDGDRATVAHWLRTAEHLRYDGPLPDRATSITSAVALVRATFGFDGFKAMEEAAQVAADLETDPTSPWYGAAQANLGYTRYLTGRNSTAVRFLEQAIASHATMPVTRIAAAGVLSLTHGRLGHHDLAADLAATACRLADDAGLRHAPGASLAYTAHAAVSAHRGDRRAARATLDEVLAARRGVPGTSPWATVDILVQLARLDLDDGDHEAAGTRVEEARSLIDELPDPGGPVVELLDSLGRRSAPPRLARRPAGRLSEQEYSLLRLLPASLTLRQIAAQRFVTVNTVKTQTQAIYRKLGATSRAEAVNNARANGLIPRGSRTNPQRL